MKITLKPICQETLGELPEGEYEVPDGCDAQTALRCCVSQHGGEVRDDCIGHLLFMRGGRHISPDAALNDGDRLMVLRPVYGG